MKRVLMKCGCVAQGVCDFKEGKKLDPPIPVCVIHDCYDVEKEMPDLTGRTAKCSYFGAKKMRHKDECNYKCHGNPICICGDIPSSYDLPFFKYQPDKPQDDFYCGCFGWD